MGKKDGKVPDKDQTFAWKEVIHQLSKEFDMSWFEVTQMNIYTFNDRCKFIETKMKKELIQSKRNASTNKSTRSRRSK